MFEFWREGLGKRATLWRFTCCFFNLLLAIHMGDLKGRLDGVWRFVHFHDDAELHNEQRGKGTRATLLVSSVLWGFMVDEVTKLGAGVYVYTNLQRCTVTLQGPVYTGAVGYQRVTYYGQNMSWVSDLLTHQIVDFEGRLQIAGCRNSLLFHWDHNYGWVGCVCVCGAL